MTTMKDICVAWVRKGAGPFVSEAQIEELANAFFNRDPTGELCHVISAGYILGMIEPPDELKPYFDEITKQASVVE